MPPPASVVPTMPTRSGARWLGLPLACVLGLVILLFQARAAYARPAVTQDESILLVYADQILRGRWPHLDFFTPYGPGGFMTVASAFAVFGQSLLVERAVGLTYAVALVGAVSHLAGRWGRVPMFLAAASCGVCLGLLDAGAYAWVGAVALLAWGATLGLAAQTPRQFAVATALAALATMWRPETAVVAAVTMLVAGGRRRVRPWLVGLLVGGLPIAAWTVITRGKVVTDVVVDRLAVNGQLALDGRMVLLAVDLVICCVVLAVAAWRRRDRAVATAATLATLTLPQAFQRLDLTHLAYSFVVALPLCVAVLAARGRPAVRTTAQRHSGLVALGVVAAVLTVGAVAGVIAPSRSALPSAALQRVQGSAPSSDAGTLKAIAATVRATAPPGSRVLVGDTDMRYFANVDTRIYWLLPDYVPASYYLELAPGVTERPGSVYPAQVATADVLVLTTQDPALAGRLLPNVPVGSDETNRVIASRFCPAARVGPYRVLKRCQPLTERGGTGSGV